MRNLLLNFTKIGIVFLSLCLMSLPSMAIKFHNFKFYEEFSINQEEVKQAISQSKLRHESNLHEMARDLTQFYRSKGLSFHIVVVQNDGLRLHEGVLNQIYVHDPKWKEIILVQLSSLQGKVIFDVHLQEKLLAINTWPGMDVFSFFSVANDTGGVNLNVMIKNEKKALANISIDNLGQSSTGKHQFSFSLKGYNLLLKPSTLSVNIRGTEKLGNEGVSIVYSKDVNSKTNFNNSITYQKIKFDYNLGGSFSDFIVEGEKYAIRSQLTRKAILMYI